MYSIPVVLTLAIVPRSSYVFELPAPICSSAVTSKEMVSLPAAAVKDSNPPTKEPVIVAKVPPTVLEPFQSLTVEVGPMSTVDLFTVKVTYIHTMSPAASAVTVKRPSTWFEPFDSVEVIGVDEMVGMDFLTYATP